MPIAERVAVFDNDGTLWAEKPMPIQLDFILRRLAEMAEAQPALRARQPWKAAHERDYGWLSAVVKEHYAGDDTNVRILGAGVLAAFGGISVEDFEAQSEAFLSVEDDGAGFDRDAVKGGAGLTTLADRVAAVGGTLDIDAGVGRGTCITGEIPARS